MYFLHYFFPLILSNLPQALRFLSGAATGFHQGGGGEILGTTLFQKLVTKRNKTQENR